MTAYELRIGDWSSDVCSSDLAPPSPAGGRRVGVARLCPRPPLRREWRARLCPLAALPGSDGRPRPGQRPACLPTHGPHMKFHEYQAKKVFADYGIAVPAGRVARQPEEAVAADKAIAGHSRVVKAQIPAGGRGRAGGGKPHP